jgi:undecaprenyl-diphosphatase
MKTMNSSKDNTSRNQRIILLILVVSLIGFVLIASFRTGFYLIDEGVNSWAVSVQSDSFTIVAKIIHYGFDMISLFAVSMSIVVYLLLKRRRNDAFLLAGAMLLDVFVVTSTKTLIHFPRPLNGIVTETGFSFPSGHVTSTLVLFGLLTYFLWKNWKSPRARLASSIFCLIIALIVGLDRIYLNVHWFSDVLGSYPLGVFLLTFSILLSRYLEKIIKPKNL